MRVPGPTRVKSSLVSWVSMRGFYAPGEEEEHSECCWTHSPDL